MKHQIQNSYSHKTAYFRLFLIFLYLGCTSFGGPAAHLGYFRQAFVEKRAWLSESQYASLVAMCQFIPGPASSQVGLTVGLIRGGYLGALLAWLGFTLPSALLLGAFAWGLPYWQDGEALKGITHGLKIVAVAVVAQAVWGMGKAFCKNVVTVTLMAVSCITVLLLPHIAAQISVMLLAGLVGWMTLQETSEPRQQTLPFVLSHRAAGLWLLVFIGLLAASLLFSDGHSLWGLATALFKTGSLVFGGGHVVLPLLQAQTVPLWLSNDTFLAGYGAAQAVPGPLFTFAAFLGTAANGLQGGMVALVSIFIPSFLLVFGLLPFWNSLSKQPKSRAALAGVNAAVVGLLLAALYQPVWVSAVHTPMDFALALLAFCALMFWKVPVWLVVLLAGFAGMYLV
ncbi:chromate efflux transporter [Neisseria zoodegmatis]|uniref:Chromate transporter n=1 Tax=Neisseria zoodegmatis TaxID=326523 RepID=A0AB38DU74_9NEIS|nr:chromate efflux transporter [Neisseria zoodegmatis]OSI10192.1 chromate transporter [Neisseria zoodegmatis]SNU80812.1 chromate transporter, chromate ion transporter (CHR) family [Neisseria zoodegmatis]